MNILKQNLASLSPGTHVRITQQNGHVLDGIVLENDGTESLSVRVALTAVLSYDGITGMETASGTDVSAVTDTGTAPAEPEKPETAEMPQEPKIPAKNTVVSLFPPGNPADIQKIYATTMAVKDARGQLLKDQQNAFSTVYNKYQSYQNSKDPDKLNELCEQAWRILCDKEWDLDGNCNRFYAYLVLTGKEYRNAADAFCYANETLNAARVTYHGAAESKDDSLYDMAGATAVLILMDENAAESYNEAAEILKQCAAKRMDISFVSKLRESSNLFAEKYLSRILWHLCGCCNLSLTDPDNIDESLEKIEIYYKKTGILTELRRLLGENTESEEDPDASGKEDPKKTETSATHPKPISAKNFEGYIVDYQPSGSGVLRGSSGKTYPFTESTVRENDLLEALRAAAGKTPFPYISAEFAVTRSGDTESVTAVRYKKIPGTSDPFVEASPYSGKVHALMEAKKYDEIYPIGQELIDSGNIDDGCYYYFQAYLAALKQNPSDAETRSAMERLADKYASVITKNLKNTELLRQVYQKLQKIPEQIEMLNRMLELTPAIEYARLLTIYTQKADCYTELKDYPSAVAQLEVYQDLLKKTPAASTKNFTSRNQKIAELYLRMEDWENAKKYAKLLPSDQKKAILDQLPKTKEEPAETAVTSGTEETEAVGGTAEIESTGKTDSPAEPPVKPEESDEPDEPEVPLSEYYEKYRSGETFRLPQNEAGIFSAIADFPTDRPYALLTWLTSLADIAEKTEDSRRNSQFSLKYTVSETVSAAEKLFSAAFRNPLTYRKNFASDLPEILECTEKCIPDIADGLFGAASMRALFHHSDDVNIYQYEKLCEEIAENDTLNERFPQFSALLKLLLDFRSQTGYGANIFAKYLTNHNILAQAVDEARKCLNEILTRLEAHENMPRVRRTREILFGDSKNLIRTALDTACENRIPEAPKLKKVITENFLRAGRSFDPNNIDTKKIDGLIDDAWEEALYIIKKEKHSVQNPNDSLIGGRRSNIASSFERILTCLIEWVNAAEESAESENFYAKNLFDEMLPKLEQSLKSILDSGEASDWGTEAIRYTASELLAKLDGSFDTASGKYFFLGFLRDGNVLLNEDYRPVLTSTFCDLPAFTLPERIRRHAMNSNLPSLEKRLDELFGEDVSQNNLRSAKLIRDYGKITGNSVLSEYAMFQKLDKCFISGRKRLELQFADFSDELAVRVQYGSLTDVGGEKTRILETITTWYHICDRTGDFGFYVRILDAYRSKIANAAQKHAEQLLRQLDDLISDNYDFGVYPPESIRGYIDDLYFTIAENMLNCVRRKDVAEVADYAEEPFGYLNGFISESAANYRVIADIGSTLEQSLLKYTQKKDPERALRQFTTAAMKDIKGGLSLISNWIYYSKNSDIQKLLSLLGMPGCTVRRDETSKREVYLAKRPPRTGKVTYEHPIPAFGSVAEQEEFRVLCLYGTHDCVRLLDAFKEVNTTAKHTLVFLDFPLNLEERRKLARKLKEEKTFAKTFLVIDRVLLFYLARHYAANTVSRMLMAVGQPFAYCQPFVEKSSDIMPPELFTGREEALVSIEQPSGANLVFGGRQLGKSALLKMAKHDIDGNSDGARAVLVEIKSMNYTEAAQQVSYRLIVEGILPEGSETDNWLTLTRSIEMRLRSDSPTKIGYLLLMLDEADDFILSCQEVDHKPIAYLKNLMPGRFKIVMAGLHNISRFNREIALHGNSLIAHLSSINVKPFERPEAVKLLTNTLAYLGLRFKDESVISLILAKTNYFPGIIQLFCQKLLETMRSNDYAGYREYNTPPYEITESHFETVLADDDFMAEINNKLEMTLYVEEEKNRHSHYHILALLLSNLITTQPNENGYTPEEIFEIADHNAIQRITSLKPEQLRELLDEMWDLNILTSKDGRYSFATEGFREMLGDPAAVRDKIYEYFAEGVS